MGKLLLVLGYEGLPEIFPLAMVPTHSAFCTRTHTRMLFTEPYTGNMWVVEEKQDLNPIKPVDSLWENFPDFIAPI